MQSRWVVRPTLPPLVLPLVLPLLLLLLLYASLPSMALSSIPFYPVLFCSVLLYSILYCSILFNSILFKSILFYSTLFCSYLFSSRLSQDCCCISQRPAAYRHSYYLSVMRIPSDSRLQVQVPSLSQTVFLYGY